MTRTEYREMRATHAEQARSNGGAGLHQWCRRCGNCEYAGGFCSWCRTAEYVLVAHTHPQRSECPLVASTGHVGGLGEWLHPAYGTHERPASDGTLGL